MAVWWNSLGLIEQALYCLAIPSTILVVLQLILTCLGLGDGGVHADTSGIHFDGPGGIDTDVSMDMDVDFDIPSNVHMDMPGHIDIGEHGNIWGHPEVGTASDGRIDYDHQLGAASMKLFTMQSILTFLCIFSWLTLLLHRLQMSVGASLAISFAAGFAAMYLTALVMHKFRHMNEDGTMRPENAVGQEAEVYLPIPGKLGGTGKVMVEVQGRLSEWDAVTEESEMLASGLNVMVTKVQGTTLTVAKKRT